MKLENLNRVGELASRLSALTRAPRIDAQLSLPKGVVVSQATAQAVADLVAADINRQVVDLQDELEDLGVEVGSEPDFYDSLLNSLFGARG